MYVQGCVVQKKTKFCILYVDLESPRGLGKAHGAFRARVFAPKVLEKPNPSSYAHGTKLHERSTIYRLDTKFGTNQRHFTASMFKAHLIQMALQHISESRTAHNPPHLTNPATAKAYGPLHFLLYATNFYGHTGTFLPPQN